MGYTAHTVHTVKIQLKVQTLVHCLRCDILTYTVLSTGNNKHILPSLITNIIINYAYKEAFKVRKGRGRLRHGSVFSLISSILWWKGNIYIGRCSRSLAVVLFGSTPAFPISLDKRTVATYYTERRKTKRGPRKYSNSRGNIQHLSAFNTRTWIEVIVQFVLLVYQMLFFLLKSFFI